MQDKKDDSALGLRSTALYFGQNVRPIVAGFGLLTMTALAITGHQAGVFFMHLWWLVLRPKEMKGDIYVFKWFSDFGMYSVDSFLFLCL